MTTVNPHSLFPALAGEVQRLMAHYRVPGVALGLVHAGQRQAAGFGITNANHPLPVDADTLFQVGSISKTVTGTALMALMEQGQVALDAPLRTYLPKLRLADPEAARQVTLRHVLTHTGGWDGDYFDDPGPGDDALARMVERLEQLPQLTPLGAVWSYNNAGFYLAGRVIERVTGRPFEAAVRALVLDPLEMAPAFYFATDLITHRVAAGHEADYGADPRPPVVALPWGLARAANPVGGLVASVTAMLRYAAFHLGDGAPLLRPETLAAMHTPQVPGAAGEQLALTWFVSRAGGAQVLRHGGATHGQAATLWLVPEHGFGIVVLTNSDRGGELHAAAVRWALEHMLGLQVPAPVAMPPGAGPGEAQAAGRYCARAADRVLWVQDGQLWLQVELKGGFPAPDSPAPTWPPPVRLAACGPDQWMIVDEPMRGNVVELLRGPGGEVAWLRTSGRIHRKI